MQYIVTFIEGIITFISPCHLPMFPIFLSYLAGDSSESGTKKTMQNAFGFILGFTIVFVILGAFAGLLGELLHQHENIVSIVAGIIVIIFGLNFMGVLNIPFLHNARAGGTTTVSGFFSSVVFGVVFSVCWMPCMGALLGSALMLASLQASVFQGVILLLCFSFGLGMPFLLSALLIGKLKTTFDWIKRHYKIINRVSGLFLIAIGILMITGLMHKFLDLLSIH